MALKHGAFATALEGFAAGLGKPRTTLVVSAH
jgi:hypothetical protein